MRLLDIDGSLPAQLGMAAAIREGRAQRIDLRDEERALRLWASAKRLRRVMQRLDRSGPPPGHGPTVTFYGSGDYHHLATPLIGAAAESLTVVHFDNHPDWVRFPPTHNCGGWVNRALALANVERIVTLGVCSADLVRPQWQGGNIAALGSGRLELHPWQVPPSRVWGSIGDGPGHRRVGHHLVWNCLADQAWPDFLEALIARLRPSAVWISIDKDVLRPADAATNWDQGEMPLDALLGALERIAAASRIVGVDICGEYSPPRFTGPIKRIAAWFDHPRFDHPRFDHPRFDHPTLDHPSVLPPADFAALATAINDRTNRALLDTLSRVLP